MKTNSKKRMAAVLAAAALVVALALGACSSDDDDGGGGNGGPQLIGRTVTLPAGTVWKAADTVLNSSTVYFTVSAPVDGKQTLYAVTESSSSGGSTTYTAYAPVNNKSVVFLFDRAIYEDMSLVTGRVIFNDIETPLLHEESGLSVSSGWEGTLNSEGTAIEKLDYMDIYDKVNGKTTEILHATRTNANGVQTVTLPTVEQVKDPSSGS